MDNTAQALLCGEYKDCVMSDGEWYRVDADFRTVLRILHYIEDGMELEKAARIFFMDRPPEGGHSTELMKSFIGEEYFPEEGKKRAYSFYHDAGLIAGAFMQCYGIDLFSADMHWHRFCALFSALDGRCAFSELVCCRIRKYGSPAEKLAARRITRLYGG